jgi:hypothetical protein
MQRSGFDMSSFESSGSVTEDFVKPWAVHTHTHTHTREREYHCFPWDLHNNKHLLLCILYTVLQLSETWDQLTDSASDIVQYGSCTTAELYLS